MIYGVEFSANWRTERLLLYGNLAISRSEGEDHHLRPVHFRAEELARSPASMSAPTTTSCSPPRPARSGRPGRVGVSRRPCSTAMGCAPASPTPRSSPPTPPSISACSRISVLPDGCTWTARFDIINVFDTRYKLRDGSGIGVGAPQYGLPPRLLCGAEPRPVGAAGRCGTACPARVARPVRARNGARTASPRRPTARSSSARGAGGGGEDGRTRGHGGWRPAAAAGWLHPPDLAAAKAAQLALAARVRPQDSFDGPVRLIGGVDISCLRFDPTQMIHAAIVALSLPDLAVVARGGASVRATMPYIRASSASARCRRCSRPGTPCRCSPSWCWWMGTARRIRAASASPRISAWCSTCRASASPSRRWSAGRRRRCPTRPARRRRWSGRGRGSARCCGRGGGRTRSISRPATGCPGRPRWIG